MEKKPAPGDFQHLLAQIPAFHKKPAAANKGVMSPLEQAKRNSAKKDISDLSNNDAESGKQP